MINKPKAYIVSVWQTGMGDMYSNILNCYYTMKHLESIGYDAYFVKNITNNMYFKSSDPELVSQIFDFSLFGDKIIFNNFEIEKTHHPIEQECKSYYIYVEDKIKEIDNYQIDLINTASFIHRNVYNYDYVDKNIQFLHKDILSRMEDFISFTDGDLSGISMRIWDDYLSDSNIFKTERYQPVINYLKDFLNNCPTKHIFLSSSNVDKNVIEQLKRLDDRIFTFNFTHDFPMHLVWRSHDASDELIKQHLQHTKEIAVKMSCFSRCKNIAQICGHPSSFMCYGLCHNVNYSKISETFSHFKHAWF